MELPLPHEAGKKDVIGLSEGLSVVYDTEQKLYKVVGELQLKPGEEKKIEVRMNDVWKIPEKDIQFQKGYLPSLLKVLSNSSYAGTAKQIGDSVESSLDHILTSQEELVNPSRHIEIYRENLGTLGEARKNIRFLEKLSSDKIPMDKAMIEAEEDEIAGKGLPADKIQAITLKILVKNPSETEKALLPVSYYLPREVKVKDVLNSEGLEVRNDPGRGILYLFKDAVALAPGETKTYKIILKDLWRVEPEKIQKLEVKAAGFAQGLEGTQFQVSAVLMKKQVDELARQIAENTAKMEGQPIESKLEAYIENLSLMSQMKEQVASLARMNVVNSVAPETTSESMGMESQAKKESSPAEKKESQAKVAEKSSKTGLKNITANWLKSEAPDRTMVWRLIFIIIGFLGFVSLLFYIIWWIQIRTDRAAICEEVSQKK
ncbi:MAG: PspC domain-containing protein [bacterium]